MANVFPSSTVLPEYRTKVQLNVPKISVLPLAPEGAASAVNPVSSVKMQNAQSLLGKLTDEAETQKILMEERMRCEKHRLNYEMLRAEMSKLEQQKQDLEHTIEEMKEESKEREDQHLEIVQQAHKELEKQRQLIVQLKNQIPPIPKDAKEYKWKDEQESKFYAKVAEMEEVVSMAHLSLTNQRYQANFLKAECERIQAEGQRALEEQQVVYDAKLVELTKEKEALQHRYELERQQTGDKLRSMQKENAFLQAKAQTLKCDLDEARALQVSLQESVDCAERLQQKVEIESSGNLHRMEVEKLSLQRQLETSQSKLQAAQRKQSQLDVELQHVQEELSQLRLQQDEAVHSHRLEKAELEVASRRQKAELQREKDALTLQINELNHRISSHLDQVGQLEAQMASKEKEAELRVQDAKEEARRKAQELHQEIFQLKSQLKLSEHEKKEMDTRHQEEAASLRSKLQLCQEQQDSLKRELTQSQEQLKHHSECAPQLHAERVRRESAEHELQGMTEELSLAKERLQRFLQRRREEEDEQQRKNAMLPEVQEELAHCRLAAEEEKYELRKRVDALQAELTQANQGHSAEVERLNERARRYGRLIHKLRQKLELSKVELENARLEQSHGKTLEGQVPLEVHHAVQRRLRDLQHRQAEFGQILTQSFSSHIKAEDKEDPRLLQDHLDYFQKDFSTQGRKDGGGKGDFSSNSFPHV